MQRPHPLLMVGGGGRRILELAAREADVVSLDFDNRSGRIGREGVESGSADRTAEKIGWIRQAAGDRFPALETEIGAYFTFVTEAPEPVVDGMARAFGLGPEAVAAHPHALFGEPAALCEELERRREAWGISTVTVPDAAAEAFAPVVARLSGR